MSETDNIVLRLLRETRGEIGGLRNDLSEMRTKVDKLDRDNERFKEHVAYALGLASMSNLSTQHAEARIDVIEAKQVELREAFETLRKDIVAARS